MKLGKLNNGQLETITLIESGDRFIYNATIQIGEQWVSNPEETQMLEVGYKPINETAKPTLEENQYTTETYTENESEIVVNYEVLTYEPVNMGGVI